MFYETIVFLTYYCLAIWYLEIAITALYQQNIKLAAWNGWLCVNCLANLVSKFIIN